MGAKALPKWKGPSLGFQKLSGGIRRLDQSTTSPKSVDEDILTWPRTAGNVKAQHQHGITRKTMVPEGQSPISVIYSLLFEVFSRTASTRSKTA